MLNSTFLGLPVIRRVHVRLHVREKCIVSQISLIVTRDLGPSAFIVFFDICLLP